MQSSAQRYNPESVAMLSTHNTSTGHLQNGGGLGHGTLRDVGNEADQDGDDGLFDGTDGLESPGNASLGVKSATSDHSRVGLLPRGEEADRELGVFDDELQNDCGIGRLRPSCFQMCANVEMFVFFMCVLIVVASSLTTGYLNSVITTIEKRFEIGSSVSGLVAAAYEFGNLVAVIFVSFLGASRNIPKFVGFGVLTMGIGSLLFSLPHIIAPKYSIQSGMMDNKTGAESICRGSGHYQDAEMCIENQSGNWGYVLLLVVAQILIGTGSSPIMTLGVIYVDNHVVKEKSPAYLACMHASGALGPVLGYALGALLLQYYVDTFTHDVHMTSSSPRWIGAWWGGFIIIGLLLILLSFPFLAYPRELVREKRKVLETKTKESLLPAVNDDVGENKHYGRSVKEIPKAVLHLLKNPVYAVLLPAICTEICIVAGLVVFLPKYLESQFGRSTSQANLITGGIGIPGAVIGILVGGYLLKRLALSPKGAIQFVLLLNTLALCGFSFFFFIGCDNPKIAGANFPYFNSSGHKIFEANLTSTCNQNCACSQNHIQPICGNNGITYFSPCHAGCTVSNIFYEQGNEEKSFNYSGCSCIKDTSLAHSGLEVIYSPVATSGACGACYMLQPFLILLVGMTFCVAGTQMPILMVTLRSVGTMERSFALGLQFVCMRLFAYIPSPIFFGNAIDSACMLWSVSCERNGSCLLYDIVAFRYKYIGIAAGLKVLSMCFFIAVWFLIRRRTIAEVTAANGVKPQTSWSTSPDKKAESSLGGTTLHISHPSSLPVKPHSQPTPALDSSAPQGNFNDGQSGPNDHCLSPLSSNSDTSVVNGRLTMPSVIPGDESVL